MAEFASNGKASAGVALGSVGTALGAVGCLFPNLFQNLLGNGNGNIQTQAYQMALMEKDKQIASLEAEKYSDSKDIQLYEQIQKELEKQQERIVTYVQMEMNKNQEIGELREKLTRAELGGQINQVAGQVQQVSQIANQGIAQNAQAIMTLANTVAGITKTVVPITSVCPTPMPQYNSWTAPTTTSTGS